jgi:hypothetical protein
MATSLVAGVYEKSVDRESAHERITGALAPVMDGSSPAADRPAAEPAKRGFFASLFGGGDDAAAAPTAPLLPTVASRPRGGGRQPDSLGTMVAKTAMRTATTAIVGTLGREIMRGLLAGGRRR